MMGVLRRGGDVVCGGVLKKVGLFWLLPQLQPQIYTATVTATSSASDVCDCPPSSASNSFLLHSSPRLTLYSTLVLFEIWDEVQKSRQPSGPFEPVNSRFFDHNMRKKACMPEFRQNLTTPGA